MTAGVQTTTSPNSTDYVVIDNGGAVIVQTQLQYIANLSSNTTSTVSSFTTSALTNSGSITLSSRFTALTFTQTSTGNTVYLPTAPVNGQINGFSITNNVTNLTVSSAANTVLNGAATNTTSAGASLWWIYNAANTSWYRYNGSLLSA